MKLNVVQKELLSKLIECEKKLRDFEERNHVITSIEVYTEVCYTNKKNVEKCDNCIMLKEWAIVFETYMDLLSEYNLSFYE